MTDNPCPACGRPPVDTCRCRRGDSRCALGHAWHRSEVHGAVVPGMSDHARPGCTCPAPAPGVKVTKPGLLPEAVLAGRCHRCRCEVECAQRAARWADMGARGEWYVPCPTPGCHFAIYLRPGAEGA